MYNDSNKQSF